jgi:nitrogen fixation/metabolism regulation signal transduction histidine kinase
MARPALRRALRRISPLAVLSVLLAVSLGMMTAATQNSALFGNLYSLLLVVNVLGVGLLLLLILLSVRRLVRQFRARVMGSRLTLRLFGLFVLLTVIPVLVVYLFSVQAFNRGIDNWFDVRIEQALDSALALGRTALDTAKEDVVRKAHDMALELDAGRGHDPVALVNQLREQYGVFEVTLFTPDGKVLGSSIQGTLHGRSLAPDRPGETVFAQVRQGETYAGLEPLGASGLQMRVVVPVMARGVGKPGSVLQVLEPLPEQYALLGQNVQSAFAEYEKLFYLRGPLKFGFTLTLSLVALSTLLLAVWAAIYAARRLVSPIRDLAEGTRAVARGDYSQQLPVPVGDEIGILVKSFNIMTRRIRRAQLEVQRGRNEAELQRSYLQTVLTHLSSGVLSFSPRGQLRTHNAAADQILGIDLAAGEGRSFDWIAAQLPQAGTDRLAGRDHAAGRERPARADPARHTAAGAARRPRAGVRRHHRAHPGAARRGLGRGGATPRTRDQESAHPDPAVGRTHPQQVPGAAPGRAARHRRARHRHHRAAGRGHEDHGQRVLRIRAPGPAQAAAGRPQRPDPRRGRALQGPR